MAQMQKLGPRMMQRLREKNMRAVPKATIVSEPAPQRFRNDRPMRLDQMRGPAEEFDYAPPAPAPVATPAMGAVGSFLGRMKDAYESAKGTPEEQAKEAQIAELDSVIDQMLAQSQQGEEEDFDPATLYKGPEKEFMLQEDKPKPQPKQEKPAEQKELVDVLKEMNKAIKAFKGDLSPGAKQDPNFEEGVKDSPYFGTTEIAPPPPAEPAMPATPAPVAPEPEPSNEIFTYNAPSSLLSTDELRKVVELGDPASVPDDRMLLPVVVNTKSEGAALLDKLDTENRPVPPVIYVKETGEYINLANSEYSRYLYGRADIKAHNINVLQDLKMQNLQSQADKVKQTQDSIIQTQQRINN